MKKLLKAIFVVMVIATILAAGIVNFSRYCDFMSEYYKNQRAEKIDDYLNSPEYYFFIERTSGK